MRCGPGSRRFGRWIARQSESSVLLRMVQGKAGVARDTIRQQLGSLHTVLCSFFRVFGAKHLGFENGECLSTFVRSVVVVLFAEALFFTGAKKKALAI